MQGRIVREPLFHPVPYMARSTRCRSKPQLHSAIPEPSYRSSNIMRWVELASKGDVPQVRVTGCPSRLPHAC